MPDAPKERLPAIDLLRGAVMVLMALDHTRDFFSCQSTGFCTDIDKTNAGYFITRWVSHFCAPVFVLLAGLGAGLSLQRGMTRQQLAKFLIIRGLWLVLLELTLVRLGFYFSFDFRAVVGLVIWMLGWCMVLLGVLQFLPRGILVGLAAVLIFQHNLWDELRPAGPMGWLWVVLHYHDEIKLGAGYSLFPPYKIIPWVGVMILGYLLAPIFQKPAGERRAIFLRLGFVAIALFLCIRGWNGYGDPKPWGGPGYTTLQTAMSFLNCEKYPPSLDYLLMTLGPAFLALAAFDRPPDWLGRRLIVYGRVPLFFYILHLYIIHLLAIAVSAGLHGGTYHWWLTTSPSEQLEWPSDFGYPLRYVYIAWLAVLATLYPLCVWFGALKKKHPGGILSYF